MPKAIVFFLLSGLSFHLAGAEDHRSDSTDILHTLIQLDVTDIQGKTIEGYAEIVFTPRVNSIGELRLDLLKLGVDSVVMAGSQKPYTYNDTLLRIDLGGLYGQGDTLSVRIYYGGSPVKDPSNWGGFYFQSGYAFNLGVGFEVDPHSFGRAWFPCYDNFVERCTFTFRIISSAGRTSYCNGELVSALILTGDTVMRTWEMSESIPSYLASVAVGPYSEVKWKHQGIQSLIPVLLAVAPADSSKLKASFIHLDNALSAFEDSYGPYLFNKAGYSVVPFSSGAMEHASNIAYPSNMVNGNTGGEGLMAHELSHHWWGNLVTCRTAGDMWINEGWASYSAHLFLEKLYGRTQYMDAVNNNHLDVIQYAHIKELEYRAISGVPHEYTYGAHVYDKGASVVYNLRSYLGDSLFFTGIKSFLDANKFSDVSSADLRDGLSAATGTDLSDFFDDWVFGPGYAHISIDSFTTTQSAGQQNVVLYLRQRMRGSSHYFSNLPVWIDFYDENGSVNRKKALVSGQFSVLSFILPARPVMIALNSGNELLTATTADQVKVSGPASYDLKQGKMKVQVLNSSDTSLLRVEHHWMAPDSAREHPEAFRLSDYRYWRVDGILSDDFDASAEVNFDGRNIVSGGNGNLDNDLTVFGGDSILLLYRQGTHDDWWEFQHYSKVAFPGLPFGTIRIDSLIPGEYTLANGFSAIGISKKASHLQGAYSLSPNPATTRLTVSDLSGDTSKSELFVFTLEGKEILRSAISGSIDLDISAFKAATYLVYNRKADGSMFSGQFVVMR